MQGYVWISFSVECDNFVCNFYWVEGFVVVVEGFVCDMMVCCMVQLSGFGFVESCVIMWRCWLLVVVWEYGQEYYED